MNSAPSPASRSALVAAAMVFSAPAARAACANSAMVSSVRREVSLSSLPVRLTPLPSRVMRERSRIGLKLPLRSDSTTSIRTVLVPTSKAASFTSSSSYSRSGLRRCVRFDGIGDDPFVDFAERAMRHLDFLFAPTHAAGELRHQYKVRVHRLKILPRRISDVADQRSQCGLERRNYRRDSGQLPREIDRGEQTGCRRFHITLDADHLPGHEEVVARFELQRRTQQAGRIDKSIAMQ